MIPKKIVKTEKPPRSEKEILKEVEKALRSPCTIRPVTASALEELSRVKSVEELLHLRCAWKFDENKPETRYWRVQ